MRRALALMFVLFCAVQTVQGENNILGAQVGFLLSPFGFDDPYSGSLGAGLFYERHQLLPRLPLFAGVSVELYGYYPLVEIFSSSLMVCGRLSLGYDFTFMMDRKSAIVFSPYFRYGHYWRRFSVNETLFKASRPLVSTGISVAVVSESIMIGIELGLVFLLENDLLVTMDQVERVGWRF